MEKIKVSNNIYEKLKTNLLLQQTEVDKRLNYSQVVERLINKYEDDMPGCKKYQECPRCGKKGECYYLCHDCREELSEE